jgi:hypothetical protein
MNSVNHGRYQARIHYPHVSLYGPAVRDTREEAAADLADIYLLNAAERMAHPGDRYVPVPVGGEVVDLSPRHWLKWEAREFDAQAPAVQLSLMAAPDPLGTGDLFADLS